MPYYVCFTSVTKRHQQVQAENRTRLKGIWNNYSSGTNIPHYLVHTTSCSTLPPSPRDTHTYTRTHTHTHKQTIRDPNADESIACRGCVRIRNTTPRWLLLEMVTIIQMGIYASLLPRSS